jgi:hypothetical protein
MRAVDAAHLNLWQGIDAVGPFARTGVRGALALSEGGAGVGWRDRYA